MEVLVPIVVVTVAVGLLLLFLRRPTVFRPPTDSTAPKTNAPMVTLAGEDPMPEILSQLKADMPPGRTKRITILRRNKQIGWTVTARSDRTALSPGELRDLLGKGSTGQLASDLLAKLAPGSLASNAPPEAKLEYPNSSLVVDSFESKRTSDGAESRDVYKTTQATEADSGQVQAWYRDWLLGHGWQLSPSTATSAGSSQEYTRASEHIRLAVADPATVAAILAMPIPAGTKTIYEVEYSNSSSQSTTR
jgi:hypothetical protein